MCVLKARFAKICAQKINKYELFLATYRETQLQVAENLNRFTQLDEG